MLRQLSTDSVSSINSLSSACSLSSSAHAPDNSATSASKKKKKGWVSIALYCSYLGMSCYLYCCSMHFGFVFISSLVILYSDDYKFGDLNILRFIMLVLMFVVSIIFLIISPNVISILLG